MYNCGSCFVHVPKVLTLIENLKPVIMPVVKTKEDFVTMREFVVFLSRFARQAVVISAKKTGVKIFADDLLKDKSGVPLLSKNFFWSLSHKPDYVAGIVSSSKVGIDIEKIYLPLKSMYKKVASDKEWKLVEDTCRATAFFRYWTAKEAVLKAEGTGIKDLLRCYVHQIVSDQEVILFYKGKQWLIEHFFFNNYIAAIVKNSSKVDWTLF